MGEDAQSEPRWFFYVQTMKYPTVKELQLAGRLLELSAETYSNHGCNDMDPNVWGDFTDDERKALVREYYEHNNNPTEAAEGRNDIEDFILMEFLAEKLKAFSK